jgi:hypothetical protein
MGDTKSQYPKPDPEDIYLPEVLFQLTFEDVTSKASSIPLQKAIYRIGLATSANL